LASEEFFDTNMANLGIPFDCSLALFRAKPTVEVAPRTDRTAATPSSAALAVRFPSATNSAPETDRFSGVFCFRAGKGRHRRGAESTLVTVRAGKNAREQGVR
jgi:hypothetical protein